jgi:methionyl-tRNA synthetase
MAANLPLPKRIYGHGWILSGDEKMSKSKDNILDPLEIIEKYGLDPLRYYLLKEVSFGNDGNISQEKLESCINSDLANNYGNLCQRVLAFCEKNCDLKVPSHEFNNDDLDALMRFEDLNKLRNLIDNQKINEYMNFLIESLFASNKYFNDQEPWKKKDNKKRLNTIVYTALELIRKISILLNPVIPETSLKVLKIFSINEKNLKFDSLANHENLKEGISLIRMNILFKKIEK